MNWTYSLERMPSDDHENRHVVRVTSKPRRRRRRSGGSGGSSAAAAAGGKIDIRFFTNVDEHAIKVRREEERETSSRPTDALCDSLRTGWMDPP